MEKPFHRFSELFKQLGLDSDAQSIELFLEENSPLDEAISLNKAPFWTASQSTLLREELMLDADWAEVIDQLNKSLRR